MRPNPPSALWLLCALASPLVAAPTIDPIANAAIPAGKSLIIPVTASSPNGRPLTFTATSTTNRITVEVRTNNPFWKMSVVQRAASNAPGAYLTSFRGGATMVTNLGDMTFMLFKDIAPRTVDVFQGLTASGFYNSNTVFHRVIPGFMIQGGDPNTNGSGGPLIRYEDEFHPQAIFSGHGQLALANSGKDTCGSQFFVTQGPQRFLDFGYTLFGQLLRGFNVLTNVINTPRHTNDHPLAEVIITKASLVPNTTDTVLTLTGTNLAGVSGTIRVIADDSAGGRATNVFTATTVSDASNNDTAFFKTPVVTNTFLTAGKRNTNYLQTVDLEGNRLYFDAEYADLTTYLNATNANIYTNGTVVFSVVPGYVGPLKFNVYVSDYASFAYYDKQAITFTVGDTSLTASGTNFIAQPLSAFTDQLLATFTNGVAGSSATNFTALINWGDNSSNAGVILTNVAGRKEVRGSHTYTNGGSYPVYVTIQSRLGSEARVVSTALVPPTLGLTRTGSQSVLRWPAWATDYQLQTHTNLSTPNWVAATNFPALSGYELVQTNSHDGTSGFHRLRR